MTTDTSHIPSVAHDTTSSSKTTEMPIPQKYRMVALDLDGTLLNSEHKLTDETAEYLRYLDQQGFMVSIATGRAISTVYETIKALNIPKPIPVVCSNGAEGFMCMVVERPDGKRKVVKEPLFSIPVPMHVAQRAVELAKQLGLVTQYYVGEHIYANPVERHHHTLTQLYRELTGSKTIYVTDDFARAMQKGPPSKELVLCRTKEQDRMMLEFAMELTKEEYLFNGKTVTMVRGNLGWFMEVLGPDVCKGNGLIKMCSGLGVDIAECVAFGDGDNDLEFLQFAGKGFAMKNARDCVKEIADEVIEYTNNEGGVMKTLKALEEQGSLIFTTIPKAERIAEKRRSEYSV